MPGLKVFRSNRLEPLAAQLTARLGAPGGLPEDPFEKVEIAVPSRGVASWLRGRLARDLGVASGFDLRFPAGLLEERLAALSTTGAGAPADLRRPERQAQARLGLVAGSEGEGAEPGAPAGLRAEGLAALGGGAVSALGSPMDPWQPDGLVFELLDLLGGPEGEEFSELRGEVFADGGVVSARGFALARELCAVFDRYVAYRPELAVAWSAGRPAPGVAVSARLDWQRDLFACLQRRMGPEARHAAARVERARWLLDWGQAELPPLRVFGAASLAPTTLSLLEALARRGLVELYLLSPTREWWADLRPRRVVAAELGGAAGSPAELDGDEGHPLLSSLGRRARDSQALIEELCYDEGALEPGAGRGGFVDPAVERARPRALDWLQSDILALRHPRALRADAEGFEARRLGADDVSVQVHACHGRMRQVEVLRDALWAAFARSPDLEPGDVLVLCPDLEAFAPLVTAVFEAAGEPGGAPRIPVSVAAGGARSDPLREVLAALFGLVGGRFELDRTLDLLALPPVRARFGIEAAELPHIAAWLHESGVRWAVDAAHRGAHGLPPDPQNTWRFGLDRIALGLVMPAGAPLWRGVAPFETTEGRGIALIGRFVDFFATLCALLEQLDAPRALGAWLEAVLGEGAEAGLLGRLTRLDREQAWLAPRLEQRLSELGARAGAERRQSLLDAAGFARVLAEALEDRAGPRLRPGAVCFGSPSALRGVPARVLCLLGMDDGVFPRATPRSSLDLMAQDGRRGDPDAREEDRGLFLDALLAARDELIVLYEGRCVRRNEARPPAAPLAELLDVLDASFPEPRPGLGAGRWLHLEHPLQGFSARGYRAAEADAARPAWAEGEGWGFSAKLARALTGLTRSAPRPFLDPGFSSAPPAPVADVSLAQLQRFFQDPTRGFLRGALGLGLWGLEEAQKSREPIELDGLESYLVHERLLRARLERGELAEASERLRAEGVLPLGAAGERLLEALGTAVEAQLAVAPGMEYAARRCELSLELEGGHLSGTIDGLRGGDLVRFGVASGRSRRLERLVAPWIELLAWTVAEPERAARAVQVRGSKGEEPYVVELALGGADAAERAALARARLEALLALYHEGLGRPLPLFRKSSSEFVWKLRKGFQGSDFGPGAPGILEPARRALVVEACDKALEQWRGDFFGRGEGASPAAQLLYGARPPMRAPAGGEAPWDERFAALAFGLFGPLCQARRTIAKKRKPRGRS